MKSLPKVLLAVLISQTCLANEAISAQQKRAAAHQLLKTFETRNSSGLSLVNPDKYIEHNLGVESGVRALRERISRVPPGSRANTVRVLVDGDFVILHSEYQTPQQKKVVFDIFRFENGKIVEHWDNIEDEAGARNPSGRTQLDGPTDFQDIDKTVSNKALLKEYFEKVVIGGHRELAPNFRGPFHQHNPFGEDNKSGAQVTSGPFAKPGFVYRVDRVHMILGEGSFVLVVNEGLFDNKPASFYDFYRVENDKIAEHWDVIETIPSKESWKNTNGKF